MVDIKGRLKSHLPSRLLHSLQYLRSEFELVRCFLYDYTRFRKYYGNPLAITKTQLEAHLFRDSHRIEKGLALPSPRLMFGREVILRLIRNTERFIDLYGFQQEVVDFTLSSLKEYQVYFSDRLAECAEPERSLYRNVENFLGNYRWNNGRAVKAPTKNTQENHVRSSIRNFSDEDVRLEELRQVTSEALKTPSVCNRQHWKVYYLTGALKNKVLALQNGNAGFSEIPILAIVTTKLSCFLSPYERFQQYIDGGMFSMSLIDSIDRAGLGSCPLNWSATVAQDKAIHKTGIVAEDESVVMLIAIGHYDESSIVVAASPRKSVSTFFEVIDS